MSHRSVFGESNHKIPCDMDQCFIIMRANLIDLTAVSLVAFDMFAIIAGRIWFNLQHCTLAMATSATWQLPLMCLHIWQNYKFHRRL